MTRHNQTKRKEAKRIILAEDMKRLSDELQSKKPTIENALTRIAEALIILLEDRNDRR